MIRSALVRNETLSTVVRIWRFSLPLESICCSTPAYRDSRWSKYLRHLCTVEIILLPSSSQTRFPITMRISRSTKLMFLCLYIEGGILLPGLAIFAYIMSPKMWPASIFLVLCGIFILYHGYQYSKELAETIRRMEKMGWNEECEREWQWTRPSHWQQTKKEFAMLWRDIRGRTRWDGYGK